MIFYGFSVRFRERLGVSKVDVGGTVTAGISDLMGKNGSIRFSSKVNLEKKYFKLLSVYTDKK